MGNHPAIAVFGGGCFWCTEAIFSRLQGIVSVTPGYAGGIVDLPSYDQVSSGTTGHAEVVRVTFDPQTIAYLKLLDVFFSTHNPTTPNRQGADIGSQYRSLILTTTANQSREAHQYIQMLLADHRYPDPIITEVKSLVHFYPAEVSHQEYYAKHPSAPYCQIVINPKLAKLKSHYAHLLK